MRLLGPIAAAFVLALSAPASATGSIRIQQSNGSVQTYSGVSLKVANKTLTLTSADKVSSVIISGADCGNDGEIVRCSGGEFTFLHDGKRYTLPFRTATFYFNPTDQEQQLSLSTKKVPPHSILFAIETAKGTDITGNGKLDQEPAR